MKLSAAPTSIDYDLGRWVSENGVWEFGLHRVLYGVRVCASRVGSGWYSMDYCAGADPARIALLRTILHRIMEGQPETITGRELTALLPAWNRRPIHLDEHCFTSLVEMAFRADQAV